MNMNEMTAANLRSAYGGESQANMRYKVWGAQAREEGFPNIARLFMAIAYAEEVHAGNHFNALADEDGAFLVASMSGFGLKSTAENLQGAINGENFEVQQMYPAYMAVAWEQSERNVIRTFRYALEAEKIHAALFTKAKEAVEAGNDMPLDTVQICEICGHTHLGEAPGTCPVCNRGKEVFRAFS
jgi:rubrerythrin